MVENQVPWERYGSLWTYQAGEFIFREGDPSDSMLVIRSGRVAILKDADGPTPLLLGYREAGRLLGELSLIQDTTRTASVRAIEPTETWIVPRNVFWQEFDGDPEFRRRVLQALITHLLVADESRRTAAAVERALSEAISLRQQTTRFIVHDLQNPLNIVMATLTLLGDVPGITGDSDMADSLNVAREAVNRMLNLVATLLDAEKLKSGSTNLKLEPEDIGRVIEEVVHRSQVVVREKDISLSANLADGKLPQVPIDRLRIDRVLTNLVDNAVKFTPRGGRITVSASQHDHTIVVSVSDSGPGIPPEDRGRVFEQFVQTQTGRLSRKGFGLGLAYCLTAVEAHGGDIWVEEGESGVGARFVFSLPLGRPDERAVE